MSTVNDSELLPLALTELREKLCAGGPGRTGLSAPGLRNSHKTTSCVATYECCSLEVETEAREWYFINTFTVCVCVYLDREHSYGGLISFSHTNNGAKNCYPYFILC